MGILNDVINFVYFHPAHIEPSLSRTPQHFNVFHKYAVWCIGTWMSSENFRSCAEAHSRNTAFWSDTIFSCVQSIMNAESAGTKPSMSTQLSMYQLTLSAACCACSSKCYYAMIWYGMKSSCIYAMATCWPTNHACNEVSTGTSMACSACYWQSTLLSIQE